MIAPKEFETLKCNLPIEIKQEISRNLESGIDFWIVDPIWEKWENEIREYVKHWGWDIDFYCGGLKENSFIQIQFKPLI